MPLFFVDGIHVLLHGTVWPLSEFSLMHTSAIRYILGLYQTEYNMIQVCAYAYLHTANFTLSSAIRFHARLASITPDFYYFESPRHLEETSFSTNLLTTYPRVAMSTIKQEGVMCKAPGRITTNLFHVVFFQSVFQLLDKLIL